MDTAISTFAKRTADEEIEAYAKLCNRLRAIVPMEDAIARLVTSYYIKHKLVKLDRINRDYPVKHGKLLSDYAVAACIIIVTPVA